MKKYLVFLLSLLLLLSVCGCSSPANTLPELTSAAVTPAPTQEATQSPTEEPAPEPTEAPAPYTVEIVQGTDKNDGAITVSYPQISGWGNTERQERWNKWFASFDFDESSEEHSSEGLAGYALVPDILEQTDESFTVLFTGYADYEGAAHPYAFAYGITVDMTTGEQNPLPDTQILADALYSGNFTIFSGVEDVTLDDICNTWGEKATQEDITNALLSLNDPLLSDIPATWFYIDGKPCLIFSVNHALGDYVILQINLE